MNVSIAGGRARRPGLQPGVSRSRLSACCRSLSRACADQPDRVVRSAAWHSRRPPGQHDRDRARRRSSHAVPIYSLYSETREPTEEMLRDVDVIVVDLQGVGCRIYTFAYTMANCMRAAKRLGKKVVVCDRPNPINGESVAGNLLELVAGFVCWSVSSADSSRNDARRTCADVQ